MYDMYMVASYTYVCTYVASIYTGNYKDILPPGALVIRIWHMHIISQFENWISSYTCVYSLATYVYICTYNIYIKSRN